MKIEEAKQKIVASGRSWSEFTAWMYGQTMSLTKDGETDIYDYDVDRFIRHGGKESAAEFD